MAITNLRQARQLYAMGQRVAKTMDGSRPGYRGSDYGDEEYSRGAYSSPSTSSYNPGAGGVVDHSSPNTGSASTDDRSSALQTYNTKKATGRLGRIDQEGGDLQYNKRGQLIDETGTRIDKTFRGGFTGPLNTREQAFQEFLDYRRPVKGFGLSKFFEGPMQAFSDFNASINRPFFQKVITAGKIPGLSFDSSFEEFEKAYQEYMANRLAGKTDAYGNPMRGFEYGDDGVLTGRFDDPAGGGIMDVAVDDTITDDPTTNIDFFSRFLQNRTPGERAAIEANIPIRFPNLFT
jgi:hypothetical protein